MDLAAVQPPRFAQGVLKDAIKASSCFLAPRALVDLARLARNISAALYVEVREDLRTRPDRKTAVTGHHQRLLRHASWVLLI